LKIKTGPFLKTSLQQGLKISSQLKQSLDLLALGGGDLQTYLREKFYENPFIKNFGQSPLISDNPLNYKEWEESLISHYSLQDHLLSQIFINCRTKEETKAAEILVYHLDDKGLLEVSLEELSLKFEIELKILEEVRQKLLSLNTAGCGAFSIQESMIAQIDYFSSDFYQNPKIVFLAKKILKECFFDFIHNKQEKISRSLKISKEEMSQVYLLLKKCSYGTVQDLFFTGQGKNYLYPDLFVYKNGPELLVVLNEGIQVDLELSKNFPKEEKGEMWQEKKRQARWLIKGLKSRKATLLKVATLLVEKQKKFFLEGKKYLKPLSLREIALELHFHESTISRATNQKYMQTSQGIIEMRSLFTNQLEGAKESFSPQTIQCLIEEFVALEKKDFPLSDEDLSRKLQEKGIFVARRTIAKYRNILNIPTSTLRRKK